MKTPKEKIKDKIKTSGGKFRTLSAQDFKLLTKEEKETLKLVIQESGGDYDEYEKQTMALFPKEVVMPKIQWRKS